MLGINVGKAKRLLEVNKPKISVIVPAYNVEKYIERAVDSILAQSYSNYEIIIVEDCSTDNTYHILSKYKSYRSINIIRHQENKGLGPARNTGLENAKGDYIFFIDSDDWIEADTLEKLYEIAKKENAEIVACGAKRVFEDGTSNVFYSKSIRTIGGTAALEMMPDYTIADVAWNKLYKRELIERHNLRFPAIFHEDLNFAIEVIYHCNFYISIPDQLYNYYQSDQSITRRKISDKHIIAYIARFKLFDKFVNSINQDTEKISSDLCMNFYKSMSYNTKHVLLAFCDQTTEEERDNVLKCVYSQQFGNGYYYVKNLMDSLIDYKKSFDITISFLKVLNKSKEKKIVFFGTGKASETLYSYFPLAVSYFVDNNSGKWNKSFKDLPIYGPQELAKENYDDLLIIIASQYGPDITNQLIEMGFKKDIHFFDGYEMFKVIF